MVKSLRWRVQIWHAWVLLAVLMIFGAIVYDQLWRSRLQQIDAELDRSAGVIMTRLRWLLPWPTSGNRNPAAIRVPTARREDGNAAALSTTSPTTTPPGDNPSVPFNNSAATPGIASFWLPRQIGDPMTLGCGVSPTIARFAALKLASALGGAPRSDDPRNFYRPPERGTANLGLPEEFRQLFEGQEESRLYFVIWDHFGTLLQKSDGAPDDVQYPNLHVGPDFLPKREVRTRGPLREVVHVARYDMDVLIGRSIRQDMAAQQASGALLALVGMGVLACGLVGGWWLSNQAVRPIAAMSATASAISAQNLDQRIDIHKTDDELGQLALVLNDTFDRLQTSFERQGRFTADASHELRTPLAVILAHTELALARPRNTGEYQDALSACQRAAERMKSLLDGLLTLARFDAGQSSWEFARLDLEAIALETVEMLRPLGVKRGIVIKSVTERLEVAGDQKRLAQVLTNLVTNAIGFNRDGGTIKLQLARDDRQAVMTVSDTGKGISAEHLPHVFDRFYRADTARSDGGSGLGLSICKAIVTAHGGQISVRSQPKEGTTFEVRLPLANLAEKPQLASPASAGQAADRLPLPR